MALTTNLQRVLLQRQPGGPLPREFYTDEALYAADLELIFYREWLFGGHTCEVPDPGSYFTVQIGAYPIVVVRGNDGVIRAFLNSCRHRGARICRESHGKSPKLMCPYHQWTYNLDGRLFAARQMGPEFDRSRHGLKTVHCEAVAGYVFVCPTLRLISRRSGSSLRPTLCRMPSIRHAWHSLPRLSRRATGNWCGRTTVSATTARRIILSLPGPSPIRPGSPVSLERQRIRL